jgi:hypothetical protein
LEVLESQTRQLNVLKRRLDERLGSYRQQVARYNEDAARLRADWQASRQTKKPSPQSGLSFDEFASERP